MEPVFTGVGVALVTLFDEDGEIDVAATAAHAARLVEAGLQAVLVSGSTGEAPTLSAEERVLLLEGVRDAVPDDIPVLAAIGLIVFMLILIWFAVLPVAVFALDLLFVLLVAAGGVATRVLFRRPWIVEASTAGETRHWPVVGLRSSRALVGEVSWAIQNGRKLEEL